MRYLHKLLDHTILKVTVSVYQVSEEESEVRESRKIKVKHKKGKGQSDEGQKVRSPNKRGTVVEKVVDSKIEERAESDKDLTDDENIAEDDLDKMLLSKAMRTNTSGKRKRRTRNGDNNNNNGNNRTENETEDDKVSAKDTNERSVQNVPSENSMGNTRSIRQTVQECKGSDRMKGTPVKDAHTGPRQTPIKDVHTGPKQTPIKDVHTGPRQTPIKDVHTGPRQTPIKDVHTGPRQTPIKDVHTGSKLKQTPIKDAHTGSKQTPVKDAHTEDAQAEDVHTEKDVHTKDAHPEDAHAGTKQIDNTSIKFNETNEDDSEFKSCASSPVTRSVSSAHAGSGKSGKRKLMSRSPELFDTQTKQSADLHQSGEEVCVSEVCN